MKPSHDLAASSDDPNFEQMLQEIEQALTALKARHAQVQTDRQRQHDLKQHFDRVQQDLRTTRSQPAQAELNQIKKQLAELELALESQLFSWSGFKEIFWLAVRFGGIGIVIGWLLKSCAG